MIPFIDLKSQQNRIRPQIDAAIKRVLDHGKYIMGPEVFELEEKLSSYCGVKHAITCSNGTDALLMVLMAKGIGPNDAVFLPSFTFTATPEVVALLGATPVFVDVLEGTFNIDPKSLEKGITIATEKGLNPKAVIPVDLFGQPADYHAIEKIAEDKGLWILADAAQGFGATLNGKKVGSLAFATTTSFFPAKPLGCYGDGGAIFTDDDDLADALKSIRIHGKGNHKYDNVRVGLNARLDTIQAAILIEKLKIFDDELLSRQKTANAYNDALKKHIKTPELMNGTTSAWAQYTVVLPKELDRSKFMESLKNAGIPSVIYYAKPLHMQTAYNHFPATSMMVSEKLSERVISLPMSGYVSEEVANLIKNIVEVGV